MSKTVIKEKEVKLSDNHVAETFEGKTTEELEEIVTTLQAQAKEHNERASFHQTMLVKAQGALEVLLQLIPEKVKNDS